MGNLTAGLAILELARGDLSLATFMGVQSALAMTSISLLGSNEQKQRWLPPMARLERIGAFGVPGRGNVSTGGRGGSPILANGVPAGGQISPRPRVTELKP